MSAAPRVVKLGGSLLSWPALADTFARWLAAQPPAVTVVIVGGGPLVDAIRDIDRSQRLSPVAAHWLAIRAMSVTAALFGELVGETTLVTQLDALPAAAEAALHIVDVEQFLRADAASTDPLPCDWQVTSDSIAARVATAIGAAELVLLKSVAVSGTPTCDALARSGLVDRYFPRAAAGLAVRWVNLRQPDVPGVRLA